MKRWFLAFLQLLVSTGLLYYIFTIAPLEQIFSALTSANLELVVLAFAFIALGRYADAYQMKMVTDCQAMGVSTFRIFQINLATSFYELFLPSYIGGGAIRWYKLSQSNGRRAEALAAIGFNRLIILVMMVLIGTGCWMFDEQARASTLHGTVFIVLLGLLVIGCAILMKGKGFLFLSTSLRKKRFPIVPHMLQSKAEKVTRAFGKFQSLPLTVTLRILGLGLIHPLLLILIMYLLAMSLALPLSPLNIGWVRSCIFILLIVPISVAGLGVREWSLAVLLPPYGVTSEEAVALSFLLFLLKISWGVLGGIVEGWHLFGVTRKITVSKQIST